MAWFEINWKIIFEFLTFFNLGGVQASEELEKKLEGFDTGFARVFALGDKDHLYPKTAGQMKKICTK